MSSLFKRFGTQKRKFDLEIALQTLEINVSTKENCKAAILLRRGKKAVEIKSPVPITAKKAIFSQSLNRATTLFLNKKSGTFLEKVVFLELILIFPSIRKFAGSICLDLAAYADASIVQETLKFEKCPDKNASLSMKVIITPRDSAPQHKKSAEKSLKTTNTPQKKPNKPGKDSGSGSSYSESESSSSSLSRDFETKSDNTGIKNRKSPANLAAKKALNNTVMQEPQKTRQSSIDKKLPTVTKIPETEEKEVEIGLFQDARRKEGLKIGQMALRPPENLNLSSNLRSLLTSGLKDEPVSLNKSTISMKTQDLEPNTDDNTNSTSIEFSLGKIKTLQRDLNEKTRENQVLSLNIQKLQKELFSANDKLEKARNELMEKSELLASCQESNKQLENQVQVLKSRLQSLEKEMAGEKPRVPPPNSNDSEALTLRNQELVSALEALNTLYQTLNAKHQSLLLELGKFEKSPFMERSSNFTSPKKHQSQIYTAEPEEDSEKKALRCEVENLKMQSRLLELRLKESVNSASGAEEIRGLRLEIEHRERLIKDLRDELKGKSSKTRERIESLEREVLEKNREIENLRNSQLDIEISRLEIENKSLMKTIKELQGKLSKGRVNQEGSFSKENEELRRALKTKELDCEDLLEKLHSLQRNEDDSRKTMEDLMRKVGELEKEKRDLWVRLDEIKEEVLIQKLRIAKVQNVALETGDSDFVEMIERAILD